MAKIVAPNPVTQLYLARGARRIAGRKDVLYHGTRYPMYVLQSMELRYRDIGDPATSFSRSPEIAAYWALLQRDDDEGHGGILILDRQSLRCRYRIEPWDALSAMGNERVDEMEERIWGCDIYDLYRHLIAFVPEPRTLLLERRQ